MILNSCELAGLIYTTLQKVIATGAEEVVREIIFTLPLQFDRRVDLQSDGGSLAHIVIHQPTAKATSGTRLVDDHLVFRQLQHGDDHRQTSIRLLAGRPYL